MNIFAVSASTKECARCLDDSRVVKMTLETAQLLSTVGRNQPLWFGIIDVDLLYQPTHVKHPCAIWVNKSLYNFEWTRKLLFELGIEYTRRFGKVHKSTRINSAFSLKSIDTPYLPNRWENCTPYKTMDTFEAYRRTLREKWDAASKIGRHPRWTNSQPPEWRFQEYSE